MTKKVTQNVTNSNSEDLTEQLKKGELPEDFYYVISDSEFIKICYVKQNSTDYIKLICSKVPSYKQWQAKLEENAQLKERVYEFAEANQSLRKQLDEERAKNRIDYYNGSPMDYLDGCERARRKNKIFQNWIKNINKELLTSELRKTKEGNLFIVNLLKKIDQVLQENKL